MGKETTLDSSDSLSPLLDDSAVNARSRTGLFRRGQIVFNVFAVIYLLVTVPLLVSRTVWHIPKPFSPINHLVSYELQPLLFHEYDARFSGEPEDIDAHWRRLLEPMDIRVSKEELRQAHADFDDKLVELPDGDHIASLAVYHELHCLDGLRKNLNKDYYFPNMTREQETFNTFHQSHCLESIRRTLMCKADASIYAGYWIAPEGSLPSKELRSNSQQVCSNWESIESWARQRMLPKGQFMVKAGPFDELE